jgi:ribulose 1,5-bisphosphate carboxylase large subunit-like protein
VLKIYCTNTKHFNFLFGKLLAKADVRSIHQLSLVGMQLPEKYKENFDVSREGPSFGVTVNPRRMALR